MKIELAEQVVVFVKSLAPEPRRRLTLAIKDLAEEAGEITTLRANFEGYWRLRVNDYRVIFWYVSAQVIRCELAERRSVVYELFALELKKRRDF